uniref:Uncharacterized protein n=1 Tax=Medicago truncatula TaxID=3880 RepID=Q2HSA8_MEDTR|nr:hypothetical protein MtrDRAFT_AC151598g33v2 [Medicago truncatula]
MKTNSNTNIDLEEDETQQQNTGSDAGLKRKHNLDHKKVTVNDKEKTFVGKVKEDHWMSETTDL